ncbi:hypothetical protein Gotur_033152 [Gossypium turneri]
MEKGFLDKVEDNAAVQTWSEITQQEKCDSLAEGYVSELWDFTRVSVTQNSLQELKEIWDRWNDEIKKKIDVFALGIYGLVVFPKALGHIDEAVTDLFDRIDKGVTPVPAILAETFRSLNKCRREDYSPLKEIVAIPRQDDVSEERWLAILQNLQEEDIEWRTPWMLPDEILYRCGDFDWVPLLGIWGATGYAPLLVLRQYRSRQFVPTTQGLAQSFHPKRALVYIRLLDRKLIMEKGFLDKVEDNAAVQTWSETTQQEKGDSLAEGYVSELWDFTRKLMNITGMSEQWVAAQIKQKGDSKCIPWKNLKDLILVHPDMRKKIDVFALGIYGLIVFPKALGHIDEAATDLFDRLDKGVTPVPVILAETFRSLNKCQREGEGRFIGCAQLLLAWFHSHFWKVDKISYRDFSKDYSPLKEIVAIPRQDDVSEERWLAILQNLQEEDIEWRAPWMLPDEILYRCGDFDWVPLLGIWGATGYAPLLVLRQYRQTRRLKRLVVGPSTTPKYIEWLNRRINDNIPVPSQGDNQLAEKHVRVVLSELEIIRQDFERKNSELEEKIEQMEEEKMNLKLDIDVQKLETEGLRKGKRKVEEDLNSLKTDYKKLRLSVRTAGLGKTSEQWRQEVQEEKNEKDELKARVAELEETVHQYRNHNVVMELQASLSRIEQMKRTVEGLEMALQNYEGRVEHLEANEDHQSEQLHYLQDQVARRDHIMGEAVVQIQGVAEHLQTLAIQDDILSENKMKQDMSEKMRESQEDIVAKLTQLITKGSDKGKGSMTNVDEGNDDEPFYPPENSLPNHTDGGVNMMGEDRRIKADIADVKTPLRWVWKEMVKRGLIASEGSCEKRGNYCEFRREVGHEIQECTEFRAMIQGMMDNRGWNSVKEFKRRVVYARQSWHWKFRRLTILWSSSRDLKQ